MTQTASTDWTVAVQPDGTLGQSDDDGDGTTLEDRARAVLGNKPMRGTLPDNELNQDLLFKFLLSEIAAQRGDLQFAAQGYSIWPGDARPAPGQAQLRSPRTAARRRR
jgi:hypothetical protein